MNKQEVMAKVALTEKDTGSPEVQVANRGQVPQRVPALCSFMLDFPLYPRHWNK